MNVFKLMRIVVLLSILFVIVVGAWLTEKRMAAWDRPILVTVYPIVATADEATRRFVDRIDVGTFQPVNSFFAREAAVYGVTAQPAFRFQVAEPSRASPPAIPERGNMLGIAYWSLKMRWWSWRRAQADGLVSPDIQIFMTFHALDALEEPGISVGMRKGRYGIVKAYGRKAFQKKNLVVFTHELLHVLGATDKYEMDSGMPIYPDGYAEPDRFPLHPQQLAEIMGGRIPLGPHGAVMPASLAQCRIGEMTAREIGFQDLKVDKG